MFLQQWTVQKTWPSLTSTPTLCASLGTVQTAPWQHTAFCTPAQRKARERCVQHPEVTVTVCCWEAFAPAPSTLWKSSPSMSKRPANRWWEARPQVEREGSKEHPAAVSISSILIVFLAFQCNHLPPAFWSQMSRPPPSLCHGERPVLRA